MILAFVVGAVLGIVVVGGALLAHLRSKIAALEIRAMVGERDLARVAGSVKRLSEIREAMNAKINAIRAQGAKVAEAKPATATAAEEEGERLIREGDIAEARIEALISESLK